MFIIFLVIMSNVPIFAVGSNKCYKKCYNKC